MGTIYVRLDIAIGSKNGSQNGIATDVSLTFEGQTKYRSPTHRGDLFHADLTFYGMRSKVENIGAPTHRGDLFHADLTFYGI
jgi:hypothetical protein